VPLFKQVPSVYRPARAESSKSQNQGRQRAGNVAASAASTTDEPVYDLLSNELWPYNSPSGAQCSSSTSSTNTFRARPFQEHSKSETPHRLTHWRKSVCWNSPKPCSDLCPSRGAKLCPVFPTQPFDNTPLGAPRFTTPANVNLPSLPKFPIP